MNLKYLISIILIGFVLADDPDVGISTADLIRSKGYPAEEHDVLTKDGYLLSIQRICSKSESNQQKPVVFLQHGLLDASSTWVVNYPTQSLGFILADYGFDVWLGNMRGNTYGLHHIKYNIKQEEFWNFSFDEMAAYDIPAMINYILDVTKQDKLHYIGHSQGTMVAFAQFSSNQELASKIKLFLALGPVATVGNLVSPIKYLADIGVLTKQELWYQIFGKKDFLPSNAFIKILADQLCDKIVLNKIFCENILIALCGPGKNINETRMPVYVTHAPAGTSTKNLVHFAQLVISNKFQMYDYGKDNQAHYNSTEAPVYDISQMKVPVGLYYANDDWLADPTDVKYLRANLPNVVDDYEIDNFNHLDFVWAINATQAFYDRMINLMLKYN